ncbi:hypothetical protein SK854_04205 [Lentzea sp. BCCO 10_0061]|uniref:Uncharacterized protein n=1 Tax=Lentzea sokolovensis TaxID=3095429 RepID=A0ABU4UQ78_9PSEU|nr:hypothetical protein [Lentzea sp. BCCO 10_0061]MDX8141302.1 hypothetical protein [Lentzea sp. BCCO 10_0061]
MKRRSLPDPDSRTQVLRARRKHTEQVVLAVVFTVVELWAVVAVVVLLDADGVLALAVAAVLSASLIALWDTWRTLLLFGRALRSWLPEELPTEDPEPVRTTNLVRL